MKKAFAGVTALLAAFPPCLGTGDGDGHDPTTLLLSGSVCRVRDSLDFLDPTERAKVTLVKRLNIAKEELAVGPTCHITNGDEEDVPNFAGQFHKSLPHDENGQVIAEAYKQLRACAFTSDINVCDEIPSGAGTQGGAKLINPLGGTAHQVDGADSDNVFITTPDSVRSDRLAAQQSEVYWMALARDVPFNQYGNSEIIKLAAHNLQSQPDFKGLNIPKREDGTIDPVKDLFRTDYPGVTAGPVVSQLLLANFTIDSIVVKPKQVALKDGVDYMTSYQPWLDVQNGASEEVTQFVDPAKPLFIRDGRGLATIALRDLLYTEAFRAALIMFEQGILSPAAGPYETSERQVGFATFGEPHILTALASASSSTRHAWYAKWQVHRLLRPEAYGGLVENALRRRLDTPLPDSILRNTELLKRVEEHNQRQNPNREKSFLLPMASAQGSPVHPAYPSGHAVNVGAYITALKAFVGFERGQRCFPNPVVSNDEGTDTIPFVPGPEHELDICVDEYGVETTGLTYEGELNKVTSNVILGRSHLGVHWRMDGVYGVLMGEISAIRRLQGELANLSEARRTEERIPPATYKFRLYRGKVLELLGGPLYRLDGQLCKGLFTGDDFCDEVKHGDHGFGEEIKDYGTPQPSKHKMQLQSSLWFVISLVGKIYHGLVHWAARIFSLNRVLGRSEL